MTERKLSHRRSTCKLHSLLGDVCLTKRQHRRLRTDEHRAFFLYPLTNAECVRIANAVRRFHAALDINWKVKTYDQLNVG